ncbi:uncharacterized protein [Macrobrachium rosenbergii]|uniref:uncharacterized protein n=1 Tax=Macrobrachium rosenbergii TaxID=79674 RepID=UPI0034D6FFB7
MGNRIVRMKLVVHENVDVPIHNAGYVRVRQHLVGKGVTLADPDSKSDKLRNVHILVGADHFNYFIIGVEKIDGISLFLTHNGMSPYARVPQWLLKGHKIDHVRTLRVCRVASEPIAFDVDEWWRLDTVGIAPSEQYTVREAEAMRKVLQSVTKKPEGYQVSLPFRSEGRPETNFRNAVAQLDSLQTKFQKDKEYYNQYQGVIDKYLEEGFIYEVKDPKIEGYYMPHFGIKKDSRTTPLRIVFNASSKAKNNKSLNECLLPGPNLVELAYNMLLKFRVNKYAMLADISKAFHRVLLDPRDARYTRFLWREVAGRALTFAFGVVVFGITASPFLLQVLSHHFSLKGRPELSKSFYVDNYVSTFESLDEMKKEQESVHAILDRARMPLEGWATNSIAFDSEREWKEPVNVSVLGLRWARDVDCLCVKESERIRELGEGWVPTKRRVLSLLVSIYDPLGLVSPLFVRGKLFLQQLWEQEIGWDDVLCKEKAKEARELLAELKSVSDLTFPRAAGVRRSELHIFIDASSRAYGAVAYVRDKEGNVILLTSKMRVTLKGMLKITIPKLELLALLLGCRLVKTIKGLIEPQEISIWSDSKVALAWVASPDAKDNKNIFISNRVAKVVFLRQICDFSVKYVPSKQNPADVLSRGATIQHQSS